MTLAAGEGPGDAGLRPGSRQDRLESEPPIDGVVFESSQVEHRVDQHGVQSPGVSAGVGHDAGRFGAPPGGPQDQSQGGHPAEDRLDHRDRPVPVPALPGLPTKLDQVADHPEACARLETSCCTLDRRVRLAGFGVVGEPGQDVGIAADLVVGPEIAWAVLTSRSSAAGSKPNGNRQAKHVDLELVRSVDQELGVVRPEVAEGGDSAARCRNRPDSGSISPGESPGPGAGSRRMPSFQIRSAAPASAWRSPPGPPAPPAGPPPAAPRPRRRWSRGRPRRSGRPCRRS